MLPENDIQNNTTFGFIEKIFIGLLTVCPIRSFG